VHQILSVEKSKLLYILYISSPSPQP